MPPHYVQATFGFTSSYLISANLTLFPFNFITGHFYIKVSAPGGYI